MNRHHLTFLSPVLRRIIAIRWIISQHSIAGRRSYSGLLLIARVMTIGRRVSIEGGKLTQVTEGRESKKTPAQPKS
jgi:hypothetical protein